MYKLVIALIALSTLMGSEANANSQETWICLKNSTSERKLILVEDVDSFDWDGVSRPDRNWHNTFIDAGQTRCEREEVYRQATRPRFAFVIPGRDTVHKVPIEAKESCVGANKGGRICKPIWLLFATDSLDKSILVGNGKKWSKDEPWMEPVKCDKSAICAQFTIQDVP